jgi:hypothetical protein
MPLNAFDFYARCLIRVTPDPSVHKILAVVTSGGETTEDFVQAVAQDVEVQHWLRITVTRLGFDKRISRLEQMITLIGQNRIRDLLLGRRIERAFVPPEQTIMHQLKNKAQKEQAEKAKAAPAPPKAAAPTPPTGAVAPAVPPPEEETIPTFSDFEPYVASAHRAEEVAIAIRNSYPGQAFVGGLIFDYLKYYLRTIDVSQIKDPRLQKTDPFVETMFLDGLRSGIAANEMMQKISIPHAKIAFMTAMLQNVGKGLLYAYDPVAFERAFLKSTGAPKDAKIKFDSNVAEEHEFEIDHAQAGALFYARVPFLAEIERAVDYHHQPDLLRYTNPGLYAMSCVLGTSAALAKLYQHAREKDANVENLRDAKILNSREFQFLKLSPSDWSEIKGNYALKLMKVQL